MESVQHLASGVGAHTVGEHGFVGCDTRRRHAGKQRALEPPADVLRSAQSNGTGLQRQCTGASARAAWTRTALSACRHAVVRPALSNQTAMTAACNLWADQSLRIHSLPMQQSNGCCKAGSTPWKDMTGCLEAPMAPDAQQLMHNVEFYEIHEACCA